MPDNLYFWDDEPTQADPPTHLLGHDNDAWNEWKFSVRGQLFLYQVNFSGLDLSGADLSEIEFDDCHFFMAKCIGTDFSYSIFSRPNNRLERVNLKGANLDFAQFHDVEFTSVNFNKSSMRNANFFECTFWWDCTFKGVDLSTAKGIDHFDVVSSTIIEGEAYAAYRNPKNGKVTIHTTDSASRASLKEHYSIPGNFKSLFIPELRAWFAMVDTKFDS